MPAPRFYVSANGVDITGRLAGSGMDLTITDNSGAESDSLSISIDDVDGSVVAPKTGAVLRVVGGYEGRLRDFGLYSVDSVVFSGWPQQIQIEASAVEIKTLAKQRDPKAYPEKDFPTYGDVFSDLASRVGLSLQMSGELRGIPNEYEAQTEESSLEFMIRIGEKLDASVTVKSGNLVVIPKGDGLSVSGSPLPDVVVARGVNLLAYEAAERDDTEHSTIEATYFDRDGNRRETLEVSTGLGGPSFVIRSPQASRESAQLVAEAQAKKLERGTREASFEIDGEPFAQAEAIAVVRGCRTNVDGRWSIETATHNFSATGAYTTSLTCKKPNS